MSDEEWTAPPGLDVTKPSIARSYDAILGGKDNFAPDRAVAEALLELDPNAREGAWENRKILIRGVRFLAGQVGIDQFLDIGSGLPTVKNTHEAAQEENPDARVVYVDNDPIVLAHGRALLADNDNTTVITQDLHDPEAILADPATRKLLDFGKPVALLLVGVLHYVIDDEEANSIIATLRDAMPSGSHLFVTEWVDTGEPVQAEMNRIVHERLGEGVIRTPEQIRAHFAGFELVDPGLVYLPLWRPDSPVREDELEPHQLLMYGGIGRKP